MYNIKTIPEDFVVKEIIDLELKDNGYYSYFLLKKKDITTLDAIRIICKKYNVNIKNIGFSGNKDKRAVTEQVISINRFNKNKDIYFDKFSLMFLGYGDRRINLGTHKENEFTITIRNLDCRMNKNIDFIYNYFDEQRFSENNVEIGKLLLQRKFNEACKLLNISNFNELKRLNKKILRLYIHSVQAFIFNKVLAEYLNNNHKNLKIVKYKLGDLIFLNEKIKNFKLPLISFDVKINKKFYKYFNKAMKDLQINKESFLIKSIPELIDETVFRDAIVNAKNFKVLEYSNDEFNKGKYKQIISFRLPKGSYATILVKQYFE